MVCEWTDHDFDVLEQGMGFHQLAVRLLVWLILNHIQIFVSRLIYTCVPTKTEEQDLQERSVCLVCSRWYGVIHHFE